MPSLSNGDGDTDEKEEDGKEDSHFIETLLFVANTGDSRAVLVTTDGRAITMSDVCVCVSRCLDVYIHIHMCVLCAVC